MALKVPEQVKNSYPLLARNTQASLKSAVNQSRISLLLTLIIPLSITFRLHALYRS